MDGPVYSLFHGGDNIQTNNSAIDEEEELKRHKSGLNDFLGDDLLSLDETEVSSSHSNIYKHQGQHIDQDDRLFMEHNQFYDHIQLNNQNMYNPASHKNNRIHHNVDSSENREEISRLRVALESKTREVNHFDQLLVKARNRNDELEKRLKLSEAEKDRASMQKQQFHELLVEGRCGELEDEISKLKLRIKNLETNNTQERSTHSSGAYDATTNE